MDFLDKNFLGNSLSNWIWAGVAFILVLIGVNWLKRILRTRLAPNGKQKENTTKRFILSLLENTGNLSIFALALYAGSLMLNLPEKLETFFRTSILVVVWLQIAVWGGNLIDFLVYRWLEENPREQAAQATSLNVLKLVTKIALWTIIILLILENLTGVEVNALIASLGVTGVAVALAVQNILGDLFSSLSIALDKPFIIGDFINVGDFSGSVEHIGLKSTRIRSITGEEVVFSNSDLLNSRIRNFRSMERRRIIFNIGVTYQTTTANLEKIPQIVRQIMEDHADLTLDRVHLKELGNFSLVFEVSYYIESPDFNQYMDLQQAINLNLLRKFAQEGIKFAYPTQTVFTEKSI
jgi:small-conductance mechanosensitive channel